MTATDPTMEFLARLNDPSLWVVVPNVPIFKPHTRTNPKTGISYTVTEEDLTVIVYNCRKKEEAGVPMRMSLGHMYPELAEQDLPDIVGFYLHPRIGLFGPKSELSILADAWYWKTSVAVTSKIPYRSVEYYHDSKLITGCALSKRDPALDLGMVFFFSDRDCVYYQAGADMDDQASGQKNPAGNGDSFDPDEERKAEMYLAYYMKKHPFMAYCKQCYEAASAGTGAGPGMPGTSNTHVPALAPEAARMQADSQAVIYQRQQDQLAAQTRQIEAMRLELETAKCERLVTQLEAEGYQLDRVYEVKAMVPMDEGQRTGHAAHIRKFYQRSAAGAPMIDTAFPPGASADKNIDKDKMRLAVSLATKNAISYEEALKRVFA